MGSLKKLNTDYVDISRDDRIQKSCQIVARLFFRIWHDFLEHGTIIIEFGTISLEKNSF